MKTITVTLEDGRQLECNAGARVASLLHSMDTRKDPDGLPYLAAIVNNDVCSLSYPLPFSCQVRFLTMSHPQGWRVLRRSLCFLLAKAAHDLFPGGRLRVEHSFGLGLYCTFCPDPGATVEMGNEPGRDSRNGRDQPSDRASEQITPEQLQQLQERMEELIRLDIPIERRKIAYMEAVECFEKNGQTDKLNLLKYRNPPHVVTYACAGFFDLSHGPLCPSTGVLGVFRLIPYQPGFVLDLPPRETPHTLETFEDQPHLFQIFREHKRWGRILGVDTVGALNGLIATDRIGDFIQTAEALHEKKIADIAARIAGAAEARIILIAGPSSAGKTTFAKRLTTHLVVNGLSPVTLSTDDYFVGKESNPVDAEGKPDYEHVEAVNLALFNRDLLALIEGQPVNIPRYNFEKQQPEYRGETLRISSRQPVIIEGIHALNPLLTHRIPAAAKFRIYISALTQLGVDSNNRLSTTDNRLMRRMVRDRRYRGHSALSTLELWPAVRRGEKRWIFPFQKEADATFNSALDYELAVLKPLVEPLLMEVKPCHPEYSEARRLSEFLLNFLGTSDRYVPKNSILREYIGGSALKY